MKKKLVITDLTRMYRGTVCIAGYDSEHNCFRPTLPPPGIPEQTLVKDGRAVIFPFALVEFDLLEPTPKPPHTEDYRYNADSPCFIRQVQDRKTVLGWSLFEDVNALFDQPILTDPGFYVLDCQGPRSIGTILPRGIMKVIYEAGEDSPWDYRLHFVDRSNSFYRLKITDLTWHYYCDSLRGQGREPTEISSELTSVLKSRDVFLRIGLARGWKKFPERCYLQITGIYTLPDYLEGKTFVDLSPQK
ncbi:MAG: hypothetical protein COS63_04245 [Anaerolineae bacterium CG06_land_8_20_14_3_00_57_67]|nr:MAG: hypothetical protein COS63_04245 [Anaerolineae bacterium CG06_land_8_20_14_3_00_57_67]